LFVSPFGALNKERPPAPIPLTSGTGAHDLQSLRPLALSVPCPSHATGAARCQNRHDRPSRVPPSSLLTAFPPPARSTTLARASRVSVALRAPSDPPAARVSQAGDA